MGTTPARTPKVAFVVPWYGRDVSGGAETACRHLAEHLGQSGLAVEVLTTCAKDLLSGWARDFHRPGSFEQDGIVVRRFPVTTPDMSTFGDLNRKLLNGVILSEEEEITFMRESVNSERLYRFIGDRRDDYFFFFTPYPFGTTYWGTQVCPHRSFIIPCLHDESYARMRIFQPTFREIRQTLCYSRPEMGLARRLYGLEDSHLYFLGTGVDPNAEGDGDAFRQKYQVGDPFVLYLGRRDTGKGVPNLINYFCAYKEQYNDRLRLVLGGPGPVDIPPGLGDDIIDLGFLPEEDKHDAYAAATVVCQPSRRESFSLVLMEAWTQQTPVLVNGGCAVTTYHCRKSNGGLFFRGYAEFAGCLDFFLENPAVARKMGRLGRQYVERTCSWDDVVERFIEVLRGSQA